MTPLVEQRSPIGNRIHCQLLNMTIGPCIVFKITIGIWIYVILCWGCDNVWSFNQTTLPQFWPKLLTWMQLRTWSMASLPKYAKPWAPWGHHVESSQWPLTQTWHSLIPYKARILPIYSRQICVFFRPSVYCICVLQRSSPRLEIHCVQYHWQWITKCTWPVIIKRITVEKETFFPHF
jgi:hypothetical protein